MAVDGVKNNSNGDTVQRQAEEYRNRETEQKRANEAQLKRLQKENEEKLKAQSKKHSDSLAAVRNESNRILTKKDRDYQKEIDEVGRVHRSQSRKSAAEHDRALAEHRKGTKEQITHVEGSKEEQMRTLRDNYDGYIKELESDFSNETHRLRDKVETDLVREKNQLVEKNSNERTHAESERRKELTEIQRAKELQRRQKDAQISELKEQKEMQRRSLTDRFDTNLKTLQETYANRTKAQKEGFDSSMTDMREEMHENFAKNEEKSAKSLANLKQISDRRTLNQIQRLEGDLAKAKGSNIEDTVAIRNIAKREREALMEAVKNRQQVMEEQRLKAVADSNERNQEAVGTMSKKNSDLMGDQAAFYRGKINSLEMVKDEQSRQLQVDFDSRTAQLDNQGKLHAEKLKSRFQMEKREMEERFKSLVQQMKRNYSEQVSNVKNKGLREQGEAISNMEKVMKEADVKNGKKLAETSQRYENQIAELTLRGKADIVKERETAHERLKMAEHHWDLKLKAQELQFENQISQLKEKSDHQHEMQQKKIERLQADLARSGSAPSVKGKS
ncbi:MAG: hypothetical protein AB7F59_09730 [Bdellovibrionales bacterium]